MNIITKFVVKQLTKPLKDQQKLQSIMLSDDYMVGLYNGIECCIATLEEREPKYYKSDYRSDIFSNPNIEREKISIIDLSERGV